MGDPQIYVRGFPKYTSEEDLRAVFNNYGDIKEIRMIRDYAFIVFDGEEAVQKAVEEMNGKDINQARVKVEIAGQPKKPKGPQPNDECRLCGRKGHWKNDCPDLRRDRDRKKRRRRSPSSSSSYSSDSSSSDKKKKKIKKHKGKSKRRRSPSSSSSSSSSSYSQSSVSSRKKEKKHDNRQKKS